MKARITLAALAMTAAGFAQASGGFGAGAIGGGYVAGEFGGSFSGWTEGNSTGGSQAVSNNYGTGLSIQGAGSFTEGSAYAGGGADLNSSYSYQGGESNSGSYAVGFDLGNAYGESAAGGGTNYSADSFSSFETSFEGGAFVAGGFAGFDAFTW